VQRERPTSDARRQIVTRQFELRDPLVQDRPPRARDARPVGDGLVVGTVMTTDCRFLLISGSLRRHSTNTALLRTAHAMAPLGVEAALYGGLDDLPHFNPDDDGPDLHEAVVTLRAGIRSADALIFSTPEYAGALPGSFKNLLDWLIGDDQAGSVYDKPVCWFNASPRGAVHAHESLRIVLSYAHADIVEDACVHIPVTAASVDAAGLVTDPEGTKQLSEALDILAARARRAR
jgi:NAD(P)H-dependent FMN reductase